MSLPRELPPTVPPTLAPALPLPFRASMQPRLLMKVSLPRTSVGITVPSVVLPAITDNLAHGGKHSGPGLVAASGNGQPESCLFYVADKVTGTGNRFLVITGAQFSVLPQPRANRQHKQNTSPLHAASHTHIVTYSERSLTLNLGLHGTFRRRFVVSDIRQAILGAGFLTFY